MNLSRKLTGQGPLLPSGRSGVGSRKCSVGVMALRVGSTLAALALAASAEDGRARSRGENRQQKAAPLGVTYSAAPGARCLTGCINRALFRSFWVPPVSPLRRVRKSGATG